MFDLIPEEYNYDLPQQRIAQHPVADRDSSKLLVYRGGIISEDLFSKLHNHIPDGSLLVFNNTRVIRARLLFNQDPGSRIEVFCLEPLSPREYSAAFTSTGPVEWKCLIGNLRRWKKGILETEFTFEGRRTKLYAERVAEQYDAFRIRFSWDSGKMTFGEAIDCVGHVPLPPYISREDGINDRTDYQTIYSMVKGSVAAPTAGLHFTRAVFDSLDRKGIERTELTLHVGAGTFKPVRAKRISEHIMHTEHFYVSRVSLESVIRNLGKIIAVGTTSVRSLESLYWLGAGITVNRSAKPSELFVDQWRPYEEPCEITPLRALEALLEWMICSKTDILEAATRIIIIPGYRFRITDGIVTNFHQPGSTLLLLVSAWTGDSWRKIYQYALANGFRFLSYGDSSLLLR